MTSMQLLTPTHRPDTWTPGATTAVRYRLLSEVEADALCRVLNLFALQCLTPHWVNACQLGDTLQIDIEVANLSRHRADVIARKMRNLISVFQVDLHELAPASPAVDTPAFTARPATATAF